MADTQRDKAGLVAIYPDNTSEEISPQDLRDGFESMHFSFGGLYISSSAETTINTVNVWEKVAGTTTSTTLHRATMPVDNRLTYTGTPDVHAHIALSWSQTSAGSNKVFEASIAKNGTPLTHSIISRKQGTGTDVGAAAVHGDVTLSTNDYLEMYVRNTTDATNVTFEYGYLFFMGMFT